jgi:hypothetical protein
MRPACLFPLVFAACAPTTAAAPPPAARPPVAETTTTSADVPSAPEASDPAPPPGKLVCRTTTPARTYALYVDGEHATLRVTDQGGAPLDQFLAAATHDGAIIVDRPGSTDLVSHAATVRTRDGHTRMQLGDFNQPWSDCE